MWYAKIPKTLCNELEKIQRGFLWGDTIQIRKPHLISRDVWCLPKGGRDLGIKSPKENEWNFPYKNSGKWSIILMVYGATFHVSWWVSINSISWWSIIAFECPLLLFTSRYFLSLSPQTFSILDVQTHPITLVSLNGVLLTISLHPSSVILHFSQYWMLI